MTTPDDKAKEIWKANQEKHAKRQKEGKTYRLRADYRIEKQVLDEEFEVLALDLNDAIDLVYDHIADVHTIATRDVEMDEPEVISIADQASAPVMQTKCPVCSSANVEARKEARSLPVPYGPPAEFTEVVYTCKDCSSSGDFAHENDQVVQDALAKSNSAAARHMLQTLHELSLTSSYIERALRIKQLTTTIWERGGYVSAISLALLRLIYTFPWLLQVSDADFHPEITRKICEAYFNRISRYPADTPFPIRRSP